MATDETRPFARRIRRLVTGVPFLVTVGVVLFLFVAYTLAGFFLAPRLVRTYVPRYVDEQLKRRAEIGEVRINPLLFKVEVKHFRLQEADGRPLLGFDRLFVDFELSSLFHRAWTFAEILLDAPRIDVVMAPNGRLNLADLLDTLPKGEEPVAEPAPAPAPARLLLQHARVSGGVLSFTDLSGRAPQTATVTPIDIELHDIATLRGRRGPYAISATLTGGGVVDWDGEVSLVPVGSSGHVTLSGFPLATAWRFAQDDLALAEPGGQLDAAVSYEFSYRDGATSLKVDDVAVTVAALRLSERGGTTPLLALEEIRLAGAHGALETRALTVSEVTVSRGRLAATMAPDGTINWQNLFVPRPAAPPTATPPPAAPPTPASPPAPAPPPAPPSAAEPKATDPAPEPPKTAAPRVSAPPPAPPPAAAPQAPAPPAGAPAAPAPATAPPAAAGDDRPWRVVVEKVRVEEVAVSIADRSRAAPLDVDVGNVVIDLSANLEIGPAGLAGVVEEVGMTLARVSVTEARGVRPRLLSLD